jgi:hypothetical protein
MPGIKTIAALTVMLLYVRWEFMSPFINPKTGNAGTKMQRLFPFFGFLLSAILVQAAVSLDTLPYSFILLGLGAITLLWSALYGILRRLRQSRSLR